MAKILISRSGAIKKRQIEIDVFNFISLRRGVKERKNRSKYKKLRISLNTVNTCICEMRVCCS